MTPLNWILAIGFKNLKYLCYFCLILKNDKRPQPTVKNMQSNLLEIPEKIASQIKIPPKRAEMMLMEELVLRL